MYLSRIGISLIIFILGISHHYQSYAQTTIRGVVRDAFEKSVLEDVHVIIEELQIGTSTDNKGAFSFPLLNTDDYTLLISHVGYNDQIVKISSDSGMSEHLIFLAPSVITIDPVTISATLNRRSLSSLPGRGAVIQHQNIELLPANNTDDLLRGIANLHVNRPWGIFSKGASVTMRGLPGSARTLILIDGVPVNKVAGGTVNWNFLEPSDISTIEIVKGPNSALYGNNAMGGVISIQTKKPEKDFEGKLRAFGGSMGTYGASIMLGGKEPHDEKGLYWNAKGFFRKGDGYYIEPEETRDSMDAKVKLNEYNLGMLTGYRFDSISALDLEYRFYKGRFATGTKIFEEEGSWDQYRSHLIKSNYNGQLGKYKLNARVYYQMEYFDRQNESMNSSGKYKLSDTRSLKHDNGIWLNISRNFFKDHQFTAGMEFKLGDLDAEEIYRTSTDEINYGGDLYFAGLFFQDEITIMNSLSLIAGLRLDHANFSNGFQTVINPTSNTGFIQNADINFNDEAWTQWSPKIALHYQIGQHSGLYISWATGFMPPKIDDLSKSGKISKGFKLANPQLRPESISNYETGFSWMLDDSFSLEPSVYYSRGHDFQYFVATGDSVETGGADLKPVLQRQNVTEVEILGGEVTAKWVIFSNLVLTANFNMNKSKILQFESAGEDDKDLAGKSLIEVPEHAAYASLSWRNRIVNVMVDWRYTGKEWYDDENTQYLSPYHVMGMKLSKSLRQGIGFSITVQNLFDNITIDRKGKLTPGRFIMAEINYNI
ncbi:MAG: TonB-dependent receptor [Bacteroidota bacterium]